MGLSGAFIGLLVKETYHANTTCHNVVRRRLRSYRLKGNRYGKCYTARILHHDVPELGTKDQRRNAIIGRISEVIFIQRFSSLQATTRLPNEIANNVAVKIRNL